MKIENAIMHVMYLAIGIAFISAAVGFIYVLGHLANQYGIVALLFPIMIFLTYLVGRAIYEAFE